MSLLPLFQDGVGRTSANPLTLTGPDPVVDLEALALMLAPPALLGEFIPALALKDAARTALCREAYRRVVAERDVVLAYGDMLIRLFTPVPPATGWPRGRSRTRTPWPRAGAEITEIPHVTELRERIGSDAVMGLSGRPGRESVVWPAWDHMEVQVRNRLVRA